MNNWKIGTRIYVGFGAILAVAIAMGLFATYSVASIGKHTTELSSNYFPSVLALADVESNMHAQAADLLGLIASSNPKEIERLDEDITAKREASQKDLQFYESTPFTPEEEAMYEAAKQMRASYLASFDEARRIGKSTNKDDIARAEQMFEDQTRPLYEKYAGQIKQLVNKNHQGANDGMNSILGSVTATRTGVWIAIALCLAISIPVSLFIVGSITRPLAMTVAVLEKVAEGDLTVNLDVDTRDEVGSMASSLNTAITKLCATLQEVSDSANQANASSKELAAAAEAIASGAQEQAASLEQTSASLEEITATVRKSADNAHQASQLASGSRDSAERGQEVVSSAINAMSEINAASAKISDIISTIDEIAFQTNLLAVNAAVEAARAGEEGRGFAVVASEVRSLAQRSAGAAKEIKVLIQDSLRKVETGSALVNRSGDTLQGIVGSVKRVTDIVGEIAASASEQSTGVEQVNTAVTQMDQVTQSNSAQTEELSATAQALSEQSSRLQELVSSFKLAAGSGSGRESASYRAQTAAASRQDSAQHLSLAQHAPLHVRQLPKTTRSAATKPATRARKPKAAPQPAYAAVGAAASSDDASFAEF